MIKFTSVTRLLSHSFHGSNYTFVCLGFMGSGKFIGSNSPKTNPRKLFTESNWSNGKLIERKIYRKKIDWPESLSNGKFIEQKINWTAIDRMEIDRTGNWGEISSPSWLFVLMYWHFSSIYANLQLHLHYLETHISSSYTVRIMCTWFIACSAYCHNHR